MDLICYYLKPIEKYNFYIATYQNEIVLKSVVKEGFDVSWPSAEAATTIACRAITKVQPRILLFSPTPETLQPKSVHKIIKQAVLVTVQGQNKSDRIIKLDLSGVCILSKTVRMICDNFVIKKFTLSKTKENVDRIFNVEGIEKLKIKENNITNLSFLENKAYETLKSLTVIKCERVLFKSLIDFINKTKTLKELKLVQIEAKDRDFQLAHFMQIVFSHVSSVSSLEFSFIEPQNLDITANFQPLIGSCQITDLNLINNIYFNHVIKDILHFLNCLKVLDITGLKVTSNLNFCNLEQLQSLKISNFFGIDQAFETITSDLLTFLQITNTLNGKNVVNNPIKFDLLRVLILELPNFEIKLLNCNVVIPSWLRDLISAGNVKITRQDKMFRLLKKKKKN